LVLQLSQLAWAAPDSAEAFYGIGGKHLRKGNPRVCDGSVDTGIGSSDDCVLRAWLFSELFPDIGFQNHHGTYPAEDLPVLKISTGS